MTFKALKIRPIWLVGLSVLVITVLAFSALSLWSLVGGGKGLMRKLQGHFPNTKITDVDCNYVVSGLCEVIAGKNLFLSSRDGRYIIIGSVLDLAKKRDLTDERLKQLAAVDASTLALANERNGLRVSGDNGAPKLNVNLPIDNAIIHNQGAPLKLKVFSDYQCGYCRQLFTDLLKSKDIEVTEYPIAILGEQSRLIARHVLCAKDRQAASMAAYASKTFKPDLDCVRAEAALQANTRFAQAHNISGTPTIIRADGSLNQGYLTPDALKAFGEGR
jgi:thiol:disulfide interchange protein DsbC